MADMFAIVAKVATGTTGRIQVPNARKILGAALVPNGANGGTLIIYRGSRTTAGNELVSLLCAAAAVDSHELSPGFAIDVDPLVTGYAVEAGTVAISATTTLTGAGGAVFLTTMAIGSILLIEGVLYRVLTVASDTSATIQKAAPDANGNVIPTVTITGKAYQVASASAGFTAIVTGTSAVGYVYYTD